MKSAKAFSVSRNVEPATNPRDVMGIIADVLEPSARYSGLSLDPDNHKVWFADHLRPSSSLADLRAPRMGARVGFREFLD